LNYLNGREEYLEKYDFITTFSKGYTEHILAQENKITHFLKEVNLEKISIGISADIFDPEKGLFLSHSYNS
jgi:glycogen synthase